MQKRSTSATTHLGTSQKCCTHTYSRVAAELHALVGIVAHAWSRSCTLFGTCPAAQSHMHARGVAHSCRYRSTCPAVELHALVRVVTHALLRSCTLLSTLVGIGAHARPQSCTLSSAYVVAHARSRRCTLNSKQSHTHGHRGAHVCRHSHVCVWFFGCTLKCALFSSVYVRSLQI